MPGPFSLLSFNLSTASLSLSPVSSNVEKDSGTPPSTDGSSARTNGGKGRRPAKDGKTTRGSGVTAIDGNLNGADKKKPASTEGKLRKFLAAMSSSNSSINSGSNMTGSTASGSLSNSGVISVKSANIPQSAPPAGSGKDRSEGTRGIGHAARVLYVLITGTIPPVDQHPSPVKLAPTISPDPSSPPHRPIESRCVPHVSPKSLKKLKAQLVRPAEARGIVSDLKRMDIPCKQGEEHMNPSCKVYTCPLLPETDADEPETESKDDVKDSVKEDSAPIKVVPSAFSFFAIPSVGSIGGIAAAESGAFDVLSDVSGALVRNSGSQEGLEAPFDRVGIFVYWWGYELSLPVPTLKKLASVQSIQGTFFTFLQGFATAGGAPEIVPFIRYISSYLSMEWAAVVSQNQGNGVVLAATWILPVALVPRPWDFPLQYQKVIVG